MGLEQFSLDGQLALVTGSSRGIGLAIARALGEAGATLVLNASTDPGLKHLVMRCLKRASIPITATLM